MLSNRFCRITGNISPCNITFGKIFLVKIIGTCSSNTYNHPGYALNAKQSRGAGGMLSFAVDSHETALKLLQNVKVATFAESLGGPETLITLPALQTHRDVEESQRLRLGITDSLLRMSVGLENADDLIADLDQALNG